MQAAMLSEVALLNMNFLTALQAIASRDPVAASYAFGLNVDDVRSIAELSVDGLQKLAVSVDRAMFTLRPSVEEIKQLASMPSAMAWLVNTLAPSPIAAAAAVSAAAVAV
jgi:hypothetical protein